MLSVLHVRPLQLLHVLPVYLVYSIVQLSRFVLHDASVMCMTVQFAMRHSRVDAEAFSHRHAVLHCFSVPCVYRGTRSQQAWQLCKSSTVYWDHFLLLVHIIPSYNENLPQSPRVTCCGAKYNNNTTIQQRVFAPHNGVHKCWVLWAQVGEQQCNMMESFCKHTGGQQGTLALPEASSVASGCISSGIVIYFFA